MKIERDHAEILTGVRHGLTLGSPLTFLIENKDWANWTDVMAAEPREIAPEKSRALKRPRPGHADLPGGLKYDVRDLRNILERASARETTARVACGALAKQLLSVFGVEIRSHVIQLGGIPDAPLELSWEQIAAIADDAPLHCADDEAQQKMIELIDETRKQGDTLGGIFEVVGARSRARFGFAHLVGSQTRWPAGAGGDVDPGGEGGGDRRGRGSQ